MSLRTSLFVLLMVLLVVTIGACTGQEDETTPETADVTPEPTATPMPTSVPPTATPLAESAVRLADVDSLEIVSIADDPAQVGVRLRGTLSNECAAIGDIVTELEGDVYTIAVISVQEPSEADQECTEALVPFDETVTLTDTAPGSYTVSAHGLQGTFTVEAPPEEAAPGEVEPEAQTASLSGQVWHDICAGTGSTQGEPAAGCVASEESGFRADGLQEDESGIEGVRVGIAAGDCSAPATEFALTDADGSYNFSELVNGNYCVSVDDTDEQNQSVLLSGIWTLPQDGQAQQAVVVEGFDILGVDFGWDYDFLPAVEVDLESCENSFEFVEDLNIPDDTAFGPGEQFTKQWLLRNNGTCPWTTDYSVVFVGGDQMSAPETIPLEQSVVRGQPLEVAIDMIAPAEPGTYRGNWQIADAQGEPFGIDGFIEDAFWLRIVVSEQAEPAATAAPNSGTIGGVVWDDFCLNSDPGVGCLEFPEDSGIFIADGTLDAGEDVLNEISITLASEACPADGSLPPAARILSTTTTGDDGLYRFENLETGMYCIFMDALSEDNVDFLIPGNWTWPATGVGRYTFFLDPGEQALDLDFGWDYAD
ncbi:MAG: hypothetical protein JSW55_14045 [Chloroflexota bacterium]|nr:MAG: hypothetical protein JSW55_14045 [Chloroflexota bacterium]